MQTRFSDLEYLARKKVTHRDRFLVEMESITPWATPVAEREECFTHVAAVSGVRLGADWCLEGGTETWGMPGGG